MHTINTIQSTQGTAAIHNLINRFNRARKNPSQLQGSQAHFFVRKYGLRYPEAHRISYFIYLVNGETNQAFLEAMETWVREIALLRGSIQEILDAIVILVVTRIDFDRADTCASVRREVIRYVQYRFAAPAGVQLKAAA